MRLTFLAAACLVGVLIGLQTDASALPVLLLSLAMLTGALLLYRNRIFPWPAILTGVLLLGLWRVAITEDTTGLLAIGRDGETVTVQGRIIDDPEATGQRVKFQLALDSLDQGDPQSPIDVHLLVYAEPPDALVSKRQPPYFSYGDSLRIHGQLEQPSPVADFDYPAYLARQGISGILHSREVELVTDSTGSRWKAWVFSLRRKLSRSVEDALPPPQSAVAQAMLLGQRSGLPDDLVQDFRETGTSHLLAISGLHVGVLALMAVGLSAWLLGRQRQLYLVLPLALVWLYALVSGEPASVVRAATMATIFVVALMVGRPRSILPALALTAAVMVAVNPAVLERVSFQFSFAAMGGIAMVLPYQAWVSRRAAAAVGTGTEWWRPWLGHTLAVAASALLISLAATLATWPLVAFNFQSIPLMGIFTTAMALPAMPFILVGSLATALTGLLHPTIGQFFGWVTWVPLVYLVSLVSKAPTVTVSGVWVGSGLMWAWYIVLAGLLLLTSSISFGGIRRLRGALRWLAWPSLPGGQTAPHPPTGAVAVAGLTVILALAGVALWAQLFTGTDGKLHVYFFDVGQGDSILIETPAGRQVLVDGGPDVDSATRRLTGPLSLGDRSLDMVVLTHADSDHTRGLLAVLDRYQVATVLVGFDDPDSALYTQWKTGLDRNGLSVTPVKAGYQILLEPDVTLEVLNPLASTQST